MQKDHFALEARGKLKIVLPWGGFCIDQSFWIF